MTRLRTTTRGLTIVELMIVVVLLGIAASTVVVRLRGSGAQASVDAAAQRIERAFDDARQLARLHRRGSVLLLDSSGTRVGWERMVDGQDAAQWQDLGKARVARWRAGASDLTRLRVSPAGVWLPWEMRIECGAAQVRLRSDGLSIERGEQP